MPEPTSREMDGDSNDHLTPDENGKPIHCACEIGWDHDWAGGILHD